MVSPWLSSARRVSLRTVWYHHGNSRKSAFSTERHLFRCHCCYDIRTGEGSSFGNGWSYRGLGLGALWLHCIRVISDLGYDRLDITSCVGSAADTEELALDSILGVDLARVI